MPLYGYECDVCEGEQEDFSFIADRDICPSCVVCGSTTHRVFELPRVHVFRRRVISGISPEGPVMVESQGQLNSICKENQVELVQEDPFKTRVYKEKREKWNARLKEKGKAYVK